MLLNMHVVRKFIYILLCIPILGNEIFELTENAAISGHNKEHMAGTVSACKVACLAKSWCKSFDYNKKSNECDLSDKNKDDVGGLKTDYPGNPVDHYQRMGQGK